MTGAVGKPEVEERTESGFGETAWTVPGRSVAATVLAALGLLLVFSLPAAVDWSALNRPLWQSDGPSTPVTTGPFPSTTITERGAGETTAPPTTGPVTTRDGVTTTDEFGNPEVRGGNDGSEIDPLSPSRSQSPDSGESGDSSSGSPGSSGNWLALLLPLLLFVAAIAAGLRSLVGSGAGRRRSPKIETTPAPDPADVFDPRPDFTPQISAIDQLLWEIEQEPDPRKAIQRVYAAVETGLGNHNMRRRTEETPGVYLRRVLGHLGSLHAPLAELTGLFELARFSVHPITEQMRRRAVELLLTVRAGYANASARPEAVASAAVSPTPRRGAPDREVDS